MKKYRKKAIIIITLFHFCQEMSLFIILCPETKKELWIVA